MTSISKYLSMIVTGILLVYFVAGCVGEGGNRGIIVAQTRIGEQITFQQLQDDFAKYKVYYSGTKPADAVAVLFCPKESDTTLAPDRWWNPVPDQSSLSNINSWMRSRDNRNIPKVQLVMGPNSQVFGYVYSYLIQIKTRVVSDKEMNIYAPVNKDVNK